MLFMIFYTSMRAAISRLYSSDGSPNFLNLSLYDWCLMFDTNFEALLSTFFIAIISFCSMVRTPLGIFNMGTNNRFIEV